MTENAIHALTFAVLAVALTPFAYWELGHHQGLSQMGSPRWLRRGYVIAWVTCVVMAVTGMLV